jgi:aminopeptidase N
LADGRFALSGATPHYAPDRTLDTEHIRLEVALNFARKSLSGTCTAMLRALADDVTTMTLDAVGFRNLRIHSRQRAVQHAYDGRQIKVSWKEPLLRGEKIELAVSYLVVKPKLGLHFTGSDKHYPAKPVQVWTQGEDQYNHFWFPCHDAPQERMTTEVLVTVPEKMTAVSNGALIGVTNHRAQRTRTFHWKHNLPHSPYLVSLAVGEFSLIKDHWRKVPVLYYVTPGREDDARRAFGKTPKMIDFFSRKLGVPYPYAKYSQVAAIDFIYGGMENTSCTTETAFTLHDERAHLDFSSDPLVAHELAHQWFGDLVTCKDWSHAWLNESFATYFEALFKEHDLGYDEFMYELFGNAQTYFDEDKDRYRRPIVTHTYKNPNDMFDRHLYEKGSLVLHMMRGLLGERAFWRSMNLYLTQHRAQGVETTDLINAIQDATGKNLRAFFDQWIFKAGHPEYKVRTWWNVKEKKAYLRVVQTHTVNGETGLFSMPIEFAFYVGGRVQRFKETVEKKEHLFSYKLPSEPELALFDPDHWILKRLDFVKPEAMWILQLNKDPHVLGRVAAAKALGGLAGPQAVRALAQALVQEPFWGVKAEIADALGSTRAAAALDALLMALQRETHPKARRAILDALGSFSDLRVQQESQRAQAAEKSYFAEAAAIRNLGRMRNPAALPALKILLARDSWNDVLRCAALDALAALKLPESVEILKTHSQRGHHPHARMSAIRALGSLGPSHPGIQDHLVGLLSDPYLLVQIAVVRALGTFADERAVDALMKYTTGDVDGRLKRLSEEAIRKIRKGMEQEFPTTEKK